MNKLSEKKNYWFIIATVYSLYVFTFGASATQSSLVVGYMMEKFQVSESAVLLADSLRLCTTSASMFLASFLYKRLGLKRCLTVSCMLWSVPLFVFPFLPSIGWLYAIKMLQGLTAPGFPLLIATILKWAPDHKHGFASAMFNGLYISGACLGSVTVMIAEKIGMWYMSTVFIGVIALVCTLLIILLTEDKAEEECIGQKDETARVNKTVYAMMATWLMVLAFSACNWVDLAVNTDLPVYAQYLGFSVNSSGSLMMIVSCVTLVTSLVAGTISDKVVGETGNRLKRRVLVFAVGFLLCIVAMILILRAESYRELSVYSVLAMAGVSWSNATFWAIPPLYFHGDQLNAGTNVVEAFSNLVCPVSTFVVGVVCGGHGHWAAGWLITAAICGISMLCGLALIRKAPKRV